MAGERQRWGALRLRRIRLLGPIDAVSARPLRPTAPPPAERAKRRRDRLLRETRPHVLSEELFKSTLIRLCRRVDRTNQPLVVIVVSLNGGAGADAAWPLEQTVAAVAAATRETDVLGWLQRGAVIGAILADFDVFDGLRCCEFEVRLRRALAARLDVARAGTVSIRFYVHSQATPASDEGLRLDLSLLEASPERVQLYAALKRGLDIAGSLTLLVGLAPLFAVIAAAVKLTSPGPILFRQVRVGQRMKPFTMLKFRTMAVDADHAIHREFVTRFIKAGDRPEPARPGEVFKITGDRRVTAVGRVLRQASLDELPQLWNVLRGEMSLVGPRPPIGYEVDHYQGWHRRRVLDAKPGITGLWQVTGRSRTTFDEMVRLDIRYTRTCSLWTDLKILLATPRAVVGGKGAC